MSESIFSVKDLTYKYGKHTALNDLALEFPPGKIYGLLGRNGAGKTTLLNLASSQLLVKHGEIKIFGQKPFENESVQKRTCFVREKTHFPKDMRIREILACAKDLYPNWDVEEAKRLLDRFELSPKKKFKQLSRGMESSLGLVIGLSSSTELTVFDEPSLGLDAVAREQFYEEVLSSQRKKPRTYIISTHLIDEVARLFDDVAIIDKGKLLVHKPIGELLREYSCVIGDLEHVTAATRGMHILSKGVDENNETQFIVKRSQGFSPEGVTIKNVPLQRLFVSLVENGGDAK